MIREKEYKQRRKLFIAKMQPYNSLAVLFSSENKTRSNDTEYPYRQDSNFYYLTGFKEDNSAIVMMKNNNKIKTILFVQKKDKNLELWNGKRLGELRAKEIFSFDEVYSIEEYDVKMQEYLAQTKSLYFDTDTKTSRAKELLNNLKNIKQFYNINLFIQEFRLIKSSSEIKLIKKAINITKQAHHKVIKSNKNGKYEYELQAQIEYIFKKNGAYSDAYTTIVAGGNNANTLHYIENNKKLISGELILIDAGCEYDYYASDITRTIPVNGKFSNAQKELYNMILDVQIKIIEMIKPNIYRTKLQKKAEILLTKGMLKLGILEGSLKQNIKDKNFKKYYPHGIGHWMGIDVHDNAPYRYDNGDEIALKEGMILTIEPGIYIDKDDTLVPQKYRAIGIRIEDNILVTKDGYENLSKDIVKNIDEIEQLY